MQKRDLFKILVNKRNVGIYKGLTISTHCNLHIEEICKPMAIFQVNYSTLKVAIYCENRYGNLQDQ